MKESAFEFTNPSLVKLEFSINDEIPSEKNEFQVVTQMNVNIQPSEEKNHASVSLEVEIGGGEKQNEAPYHIKAIECANFRWGEIVDKDMVKVLLNQNAPSLLLSYLRPIISQVTGTSKYGRFDIPFYNFTQNEEK